MAEGMSLCTNGLKRTESFEDLPALRVDLRIKLPADSVPAIEDIFDQAWEPESITGLTESSEYRSKQLIEDRKEDIRKAFRAMKKAEQVHNVN